MLLMRAGLLLGAILLAGCATTPGCRWRLIVEPRVTASADGTHPVRPIGSISARPVCLAPAPKRTAIVEPTAEPLP